MAAPITITYDLHPPAGTPDIPLPSKNSHEFFTEGNSLSGKDYYESLRSAIAKAKSTLGEELTMWRDAVGPREQEKEGKLSKKSEEDEDEEDEEDAE